MNKREMKVQTDLITSLKWRERRQSQIPEACFTCISTAHVTAHGSRWPQGESLPAACVQGCPHGSLPHFPPGPSIPWWPWGTNQGTKHPSWPRQEALRPLPLNLPLPRGLPRAHLCCVVRPSLRSSSSVKPFGSPPPASLGGLLLPPRSRHHLLCFQLQHSLSLHEGQLCLSLTEM